MRMGGFFIWVPPHVTVPIDGTVRREHGTSREGKAGLALVPTDMKKPARRTGFLLRM